MWFGEMLNCSSHVCYPTSSLCRLTDFEILDNTDNRKEHDKCLVLITSQSHPACLKGMAWTPFHIPIWRTLRKPGLSFGRAFFLCVPWSWVTGSCWLDGSAGGQKEAKGSSFSQADRWGSDLMSWSHNDSRTSAYRNESLMPFVHRLSLFQGL